MTYSISQPNSYSRPTGSRGSLILSDLSCGLGFVWSAKQHSDLRPNTCYFNAEIRT